MTYSSSSIFGLFQCSARPSWSSHRTALFPLELRHRALSPRLDCGVRRWRESGCSLVVAESRFHVLAVDDSVIDRKLIEMLLKTSSYQVTTVDSGSKVLEVLGLRDEGDESASASSSSRDHELLVATS